MIYQDGRVAITCNRSDATILKLLGLKSRFFIVTPQTFYCFFNRESYGCNDDKLM